MNLGGSTECLNLTETPLPTCGLFFLRLHWECPEWEPSPLARVGIRASRSPRWWARWPRKRGFACPHRESETPRAYPLDTRRRLISTTPSACGNIPDA